MKKSQIVLYLILLVLITPALRAQVVAVAQPVKSKHVQLGSFDAEAGKHSKELKPDTAAAFTQLLFDADDGYVNFISVEVIYGDQSRDTVEVNYVVSESGAPAAVIRINDGAKKISSILVNYSADPGKSGAGITISAVVPDEYGK